MTVHYSARIINSELWTLIQLHSAQQHQILYTDVFQKNKNRLEVHLEIALNGLPGVSIEHNIHVWLINREYAN